MLLSWLVALWIFSGAFVLFEPSPYEVMFLLVLPVAVVAGVGLHKGTLALFSLMVLFIPFALIADFQVRFMPVYQAIIYTAVTIFLWFTAYFVANYVADAPHDHMRRIMRAYMAAAVLSALVGTLAYLGIMPAADLFLRYGRAKAMFNDPNVYGPFLMLPAMFALQMMFLGPKRRAIWAMLAYGVLFIGVFVSFSRAAWGYILFSSLLVFLLCFRLEANARDKVRMLILALAGAAIMIVALVGLLSIPSVQALFAERASVTQSYDTGETGRFGRQGYAFDLALQNPWGLGPLEFRNLRVNEEPHNTYVNVLHAYGWGGGLAYWVFVLTTLWRGISGLARPSPNRLLLIPLVATYVPLAMEAAIIDTDHWRSYFLVAGLIWGVTAGCRRVDPVQSDRAKALV